MAKRKAKQAAPPAKASGPREFVAWGFWLVAFIAIYGPFWFLGRSVTIESERNGLVPWIVAAILAALGAGFLTFGVNFALRARAANQKIAVRKKTKRGHA